MSCPVVCRSDPGGCRTVGPARLSPFALQCGLCRGGRPDGARAAPLLCSAAPRRSVEQAQSILAGLGAGLSALILAPVPAPRVTAMAAPGAVLLMLGMGKFAGLGISNDEITRRFTGWRVRRATQLPAHEFFARFRPSLLLRALAKSRIKIWWFALERVADGEASPAW